MTNLLQTVVDKGTGASARWKWHFTYPAGGKTGTTNKFTDAWFVGFTRQITAGVWVGVDDPQVSLGNNQSGALVALPIWATFMKEVHENLRLEKKDFPMPPGVKEIEICSITKQLPTENCPVEKEIFNIRYAPTTYCKLHDGLTDDKKKGKGEF
jgi:penicillin-binding protein 1A